MIFRQLAFIPIVLITLCCLYLLVSKTWRHSIIALSTIYLGVFWIISLVLPTGLAVVKLVTGWMAGAVLGASTQDSSIDEPLLTRWPIRGFRLTAGLAIIVLVGGLIPAVEPWLNVDKTILWGALTLIGMGILQLGILANPFHLFIGLLTLLAGFEVIYAALEKSVLVVGLLAVVNLGLALTGAYLITFQPDEGVR